MITIVIPVHNREQIVTRTLRSVEAQTLRPLHVVLVDNASTDGTLDVITRWKDRVQAPDLDVEIVSCSKPGPCAARNAGMARVKTPWVMFFDSDDVMLPTHLERVTDAIKTNPSVDIFGWDVSLCDQQGNKTGTGLFCATDPLFHNIFHGTFSTQRYIARREAFVNAGAWNEDLHAWVDIELGTRLLAASPNILKLTGDNTVQVLYTPTSVTSSGFSDGGNRFVNAAEEIRRNLPQSKKHWINLKEAILAANIAHRGDKAAARDILAKAISHTTMAQRLMLRLAYLYTAAGLRGAARILRPFI